MASSIIPDDIYEASIAFASTCPNNKSKNPYYKLTASASFSAGALWERNRAK